MALDLTGIDNRGEFYAHHYLDELLGKDLKGLLQRWTEREKATPPVRAPHKALNGMAQRYFMARSHASDSVRPPDLQTRLDLARGMHAHLLDALGYERHPMAVPLDDGTSIPLVREVRRGGEPYLWILETAFVAEDADDPLEQSPHPSQLPTEGTLPERTWRELLDSAIFRQEAAPTWVLLLCGREVLLTHAGKWGRGKSLVFDLDDLYARRQPAAFRAMAALLHADALAPSDGTCLHDTLEESSHKHAFGVSDELREGAQQAIEILGNEVVYQLLKVKRVRVFGTEDEPGLDVDLLTRECLVWLYRLIFLFYAESRPELGVAPMKSDAYRKGYSLESLRALESIPLTTQAAQEGHYLGDSLNRLFALINDGHPTEAVASLGSEGMSFRMHGLRSRLFDAATTPLISSVRLRNQALQRIIELLSLTREGKHKTRGRISYANLGINQLGAVYEGLLSYTGFFARTDLIEVCHKGDQDKAGARTWFVPESAREDYDPEEIVHEPDGSRRVHAKGSFLYRLSGRDREKSASYYTPEVLTNCLVKYTLAERIGTHEEGLSADELLDLTICEPAMGSGAFLNEVVNQLADAYLQRKQRELGEILEADRYRTELQRVKARIAAQQCYGVDLNPLAAELGKVSLWLNVLRPGTPAPFFDARLLHGNSLVGARRAGYRTGLLGKGGKKSPNWLTQAPEDIPGDREDGLIWHFLLPAVGMAAFDKDKVVKGLVPEHVDRIKAWGKTHNRAWSAEEISQLEALSARVDVLWAEHGAARAAALAECDQSTAVWPEADVGGGSRRDEEHHAAAWARYGATNHAGRRLKAVLDYWAAMWFWPVLSSESLPTRAQWLGDLDRLMNQPAVEWFAGEADQVGRLRTAAGVASRRGFMHWEWAFPEVFARGGFDVIVGNPPWLKVQWNESGILSDLDPRLEIRRMSAKQTADARAATLGSESALAEYLGEFEELVGLKAVLNSCVSYALLRGVQTNLYKAFFAIALPLAPQGVAGFFHQKGMYDDPKGGGIRSHLAPRLRWHLHFINKLLLFDGIEDQKHYELTVFAGQGTSIRFRQVSNLFHPRTLDESITHDGLGEVPAIKTPNGTWDLRGHRSRIVHVDEATLALFAKLYDPPDTPAREARLPVVHSGGVLSVLQKLASAPIRLLDLPEDYTTTVCFDETYAQRDGTIRRHTSEPTSTLGLIPSGPHFFVASPLNKTPNHGCKHNQDYTVIDHMQIRENYLPRTNYVPDCPRDEFLRRVPVWKSRPVTEFYRHIHREMIAPTGERTLVPAILPKGCTHPNTVLAIVGEPALVLQASSMYSSIVADFYVKTTGMGHANANVVSNLPIHLNHGAQSRGATTRTLLLNCLTNHYADLWSELYDDTFPTDTFTKPDPRLPAWTHLTAEWTWHTPLRTPYARRQALVELDALAALALGLTADELALIYRIQFPVLQQYEADTWYDQRGRIVFTNNRGLNGVGLTRKQWDEIKGPAVTGLRHAGVEAMPEWAVDALGVFEPPYDRCDREQDMRQAYAEFVARGVVVAESGERHPGGTP